ncbi:polyketide synthase [Streptomyces candidus]|uniref:Acyl transferase domain-containing protein/3-hydroxymyristoyl/3-hydroxydecanoyl-(Acyl carrier protein) dehydratase n=1 Tax=Streptomyces candidus TaxID=67283 RepID=A0A7X0HLG3_9ACTN|nr:polyketide synthase [Streptomyces candidus]MBB6438577.1 acyl transferase domain-containing protein/3-hydroxymyristoyl/3-hydroxydecanoyl-(acyl carrier protein) dehydratase [Streptomyces candidus]GHH45422.1 type I polyketide synthase [Streptomyces candidus]
MGFEPIAIVGRGCVFPDALDPDAFWDNVAAGRCSLSAVPDGRWRLPHQWALGSVDDHLDRTWTDVGGYVRGFEPAFDPSGFLVAPEEIAGLDPLFHWVLYAARQALREAGHDGPSPRAGMVMGNLSYPTGTGSAFAEHVWLSEAAPSLLTAAGRTRPDARNRFSSALPAHFAAKALGLGAGAFALDAACASSLYAIKLACDRLHDGTADVMVAGAAHRADNLFLHIGFCGLSAMSRTSRSRPFHRDADGLLHGEGAGFVALMRLRDAVDRGTPVLGVVRGVGLSTDGRGRGLLSPAQEGQERAMRLAYAMAGIAPRTVSLVECHATGTPVGDVTEVRSMARVFADSADVPIGSVKSNVGHLLAAAGTGGLLKVLGALRAGTRPATLGAEEPLSALRGTPLRVLRESEQWPGLRRAAVSAFGFGGTNAHLVVDAWDDTAGPGSPAPAPTRPASPPSPPVAIVAVSVRVGAGADPRNFPRAVLEGDRCGPLSTIEVALPGLAFPPLSAGQALPQQVLMLEAARDAARGIALPRERTMVLVGTGIDTQVARATARWRVPAWLEEAGEAAGPRSAEDLKDAFAAPMAAERIVGTLPNLVANRINTQLDLAGPGCTVSAEEASGLVALDLAARALRAGEVDAALVGAVDLSWEPVHQAAVRALGRDDSPGDGAVALVLKPLTDARRDGDRVLALLDGEPTGLPDLVLGDGADAGFDPADLFGRAHAAQGLLAVAVATTALHHRARPRAGTRATADPGLRTAHVEVSPLEAGPVRVQLRAADPGSWAPDPVPRLYVYSGAHRREVLAALDAGTESREGPARLVIVSDGDPRPHREAARRWLAEGGVKPAGVAYRDAPVTGEVAFVYTNGSAAYPGMGRELLLALPGLGDTVAAAHGTAGRPESTPGSVPTVLDRIWGAARLAAVHTELTRGVLGLRPDAALGYSSGESAALVALGAWTDVAALHHDTLRSDLFTSELTGELRGIRRVWERLGIEGDRWSGYLVTAPLHRVRTELAGERAVHLMAVNAPDVCVIGGEARACAAVVARLGAAHALPIDYDLAAHAPELAEVRDRWWTLHHRPTRAVPGVRFYSGAGTGWYTPTAESAADAVTAQGLGTIDFAGTVERAWADGVRVFVEHGPRGLCTGWIKRVLGDREHVAVALDAEDRGLRQVYLVVAELLAAGVPVRADDLVAQLRAAAPAEREPAPTLTMSAHWEISLPPLGQPPTIMPPAPRLAPVAPCATTGPVPVGPPPAAPGSGATGTARASTVTTGPVPPTPDAEPQVTDLPTLVAQQTRRVSELHQEVLAMHLQSHRTFLQGRAQLAAALVRSAAGAVPPSPTTAPAGERPLPAALPALALPAADGPPPARTDTATATTTATAAGEPQHVPGTTFDRAQLEHLAEHPLSSLFGPKFAAQDGYALQTRMPAPPMLLADRVTVLDAIPAALAELGPEHATGKIGTETDIRLDSWYLDPTGHIPAGMLVEAGQADLLLISWLGIDLLNRGERAYRLLGCELTFHGALPRAGETLRYDIRIDRHAQHDGIRLFFFHYDCYVGDELRLSVRNGQAGFFTKAELDGTDGVLWDPARCAPASGVPLDAPAVTCTRSSFTAEQVRAFAEGRPADCFGEGWEHTRSHVRSPRLDNGRLLLLHEVTGFDPAGGPWGHGYLRARTPVAPDDWFFEGHFRNDPCMPGTLMLQAAFQAMSFYLAALGFTIGRDGWRFEPVDEQPFTAHCRGQATPASERIVYEVFVHGVSAGPQPTLYADVLGTVDGVKAFHGQNLGLRLVPDWPLTHWRQLGGRAEQTDGTPVPLASLGGLVGHRETKDVAVVDGFAFDHPSLLACAWGRPSDAFGPAFRAFDGTRRIARLPGPPYHFMTRIASVRGPQQGMREGSAVVAEYDVPDHAWYFEQNSAPVMPFAVLMEIALQPCGWLACYVGSPLTTETDLLFRNLDGTGTITAEISPSTRTVRTEAELTRISRSGGMIIVSFEVRCVADGEEAFALSTVFGFFPPAAFAHQPGLPVPEDALAALREPGPGAVDLTARPERYFGGAAHLPGPMLLMLDRITGYWPDGGGAGLGRLTAEKDVDAGEWFFRAHFFQDPVQPGSLGIEAMCQLLQFYAIERGLTRGVPQPRFEPVTLGHEVTWKYRGQITPANRLIRIDLEIVEVAADTRGPCVIAEARLWGDDTCLYHVRGLGVRVVPGEGTEAEAEAEAERTLDPAVDVWVNDHCPTWTVPALPMMSVVDLLAQAAADHTGQDVVAVRDVRLRRWILLAEAARFRTEVTPTPAGLEVRLLIWRDAATPALSRFEEAARGTVVVGTRPTSRPERFAPLPDAVQQPDPYASADLFHGPAFQYLTSWAVGATGSSGVIDTARGTVPRGYLHQGVLDALVQVVPSASMWRWMPHLGTEWAGFPFRVESLELYEELPGAGEAEAEARFAGPVSDALGVGPLAAIDLQLCVDGRVAAALRLVHVLLPLGPFAGVPFADRRDFLANRRPVDSIALTTTVDGATEILADEVDGLDWLPGTLAHTLGLPPGSRGRDHLAVIAVKEHVGRLARVHPYTVEVSDDLRSASTADGRRHVVQVVRGGDKVTVRSGDER